MKKVHYIAGLAGVAPAAMGFIAPAMAHAAPAGGPAERGTSAPAKTVSTHQIKAPALAENTVFSCFNPRANGTFEWCNAPIINGPADFYSHNGAVLFQLHDGDRVKVTCWYTGASFHGDPYKDHVVREHIGGAFYSYSGHVNDYHVNFSGLTPNSLPLSHC